MVRRGDLTFASSVGLFVGTRSRPCGPSAVDEARHSRPPDSVHEWLLAPDAGEVMGVGAEAEAEDPGTPWQVAEREARRPALGGRARRPRPDGQRPEPRAPSTEHRELYAPHLAGNRALLGRRQKLVGAPAKVVSAVEKALTARRPRGRYRCDNPSRAQVAFATVTPTAASDALLATVTTSREAQRA